ncbi:MAG: hypothetical protein ACFCD0_01195 [Gemmataceae bacterium]
MTKQEWLASRDLHSMLRFLEGRTSPRKLRLFAAACCRYIWDSIGDERSQQVVELLELYADQLLPREVFLAARQAAVEIAFAAPTKGPCALREATKEPPFEAAMTTFEYVVSVAADHLVEQSERVKLGIISWDAAKSIYRPQVYADLANFLRDIVPYQNREPTTSPSWQTDDVQAVARRIYQQYRFEDLPILADALEEAGVDDEEMLAHCRNGHSHVRGCWVVDLVLGKE